jgi:hypothetical protein
VVRKVSLSTIGYQPGPVPVNAADIPRYLQEETQKIANAILLLSDGHLERMTAPPPKPFDGDFRYADGVNWNPGGGRGFYYYDGTTWNQLG